MKKTFPIGVADSMQFSFGYCGSPPNQAHWSLCLWYKHGDKIKRAPHLSTEVPLGTPNMQLMEESMFPAPEVVDGIQERLWRQSQYIGGLWRVGLYRRHVVWLPSILCQD